MARVLNLRLPARASPGASPFATSAITRFGGSCGRQLCWRRIDLDASFREGNSSELMTDDTRVATTQDHLERRLRAVGEALDRATRSQSDGVEILERERVAKSKAEAARDALGSLLSTIGFELRPVLSAAKQWAEVMKREPLSVGARDDALSVIERSLSATLEILDEVVPLWQPAPLAPQWLAIEPVVRKALATRRFSVDVGSLEGRVYADPSQLERVVALTFSAAAELAGDHANLRLESNSDGLTVSYVAPSGQPTSIANDWAELKGLDSTSVRSRLFALRKITRMIGLDLELESGPPSALRLRFPEPRTRAGTRAESLAGVRVRLDEHDEDWRELVVHLLERRGATVAAEIEDPHVRVHFVGDSMEDTRIGSAFSIAVLPDRARASDIERLLTRGYARCLKKPFTAADLVRAVEDGMRRHRELAPEPIRNALASLVPLAADGCALDEIADGGVRRRLAAFHVDAATQRALETTADDPDATCRSRVQVKALDGFCGELLVYRAEPLWALEEALVCTTAERIGDLLDKKALLARGASDTPTQEVQQPIQTLVVGLELVLTRVRDSADEIPRGWLLDRLATLVGAVERLTALTAPTALEPVREFPRVPLSAPEP